MAGFAIETETQCCRRLAQAESGNRRTALGSDEYLAAQVGVQEGASDSE